MTGDRPSIVEFATDAQLLGLTLSDAQRVLLMTLYGMPLTPDEVALFHDCTGREAYTPREFHEVTVIAGARSGKDSRILVPVLLYEGTFGGHERQLGKGEIGMVPLVAQDEKSTRTAFGYVREYLVRSPLLKSLVAEEREREMWLTNQIRIACFACTAKSLRGYSIVAAGMDELAFFRVEATADADVEVQAAIKRGMVAFETGKLVKITTPYLKSGLVYDDYTRAFGHDDPDLLVWRASTTLMNPTISETRLARDRRADARRAAREYDAIWADDTEAFFPGAWIDAAVNEGRHELAPPAEVA
jgi:hypothetical protein